MIAAGDDKSPLSDSADQAAAEDIPEHAPLTNNPAPQGSAFRTVGLNIVLEQDPVYEVYFKAPTDIVTFNLRAIPNVSIAYDSDKVERVKVPAMRMHFHPAGTEVYARNTDPTAGRLCVLDIDPALRNAIEADMKGPIQSMGTILNIGTPRAAVLSQSVHRFMETGAEGGHLVADGLAAMAILEALLSLKGDVETQPGEHVQLGRQALDRTLDYIEEHLAANIRLSDLAAIACLSQHHFSRAFKASTGKPPSVYVLERRVERAKQLLITTEHPVAWIAHACGFSSQSHLTTMFRKLTGVTPVRFRKDGGL